MSHTLVTAIPIFNDNYIWIIYNTQLQQAVAVDPGQAEPLIDFLKKQQLKLVGILVTHHHPDHIDGIDQIQAQFNHSLPVYGPNTDKISQITHPLHDGETVTFTGINRTFATIHTPGHTLDHLCFYSQSPEPWLFSGDTLFSAGCGRLFEGTPSQMYHSLAKLKQLPPETLIFCTHEYTLSNLKFAAKAEPNNKAIEAHTARVIEIRATQKPSLPSTLALEIAINPFLRADLPELSANIDTTNQLLPKPGIETFAALRSWKDVS